MDKNNETFQNDFLEECQIRRELRRYGKPFSEADVLATIEWRKMSRGRLSLWERIQSVEKA